MPDTLASLLPDIPALSDSGAWGGVVVLAASTPIATLWARVLSRRSAARQRATRRRHAQLHQTAAITDAGGVSETATAAQRRTRARWRRRVTAANRARW